MIRAERIWRMQRMSGVFAMLTLTLALLILFDGLRSGIFGTQGPVHLVPGDEYAISGPLPPRTDTLEDFVIDGTLRDNSIVLKADGIFRGYWFGGGMWRGRIVVGSQCPPGHYEFAVRDKFGEKQNPALIFSAQVFVGNAERQAHSPSLVMRWCGVEPFLVAGILGCVGLLCVGLNYLFGHQWSKVLAEHSCGVVFRKKTVAEQVEVGVEYDGAATVTKGMVIRFAHPSRGDIGSGVVSACGQGEVTVQIKPDLTVQLGDIACMMPAQAVEES